ncbi:MAG: PorV/PorQ family protein [Saprospiraceae bacterium]|nr:PorV/PorQ family protein [Saprospiraceae bacterium]
MQKHLKIIILFILLSSNSFGQVGTTNTYKFLNISSSARISALGNNIVSIDDDDISLTNENPAVLKDEMIRSLSLSHKFFFIGISSQNLDYGFKIGKINLPFHAGIQFMNYGQADMADIYGDISGTVSGSDLAFLLGASYKLYENLNLGLNTRFIYSNIGPYNSFGMTVDLGAMYHLKGKNFDIGFVIKNLGGTIDPYADEKSRLL